MTTFGEMSSKVDSTTPIVNNNNNYGMPKPTNENQQERLALIDDLKLFLATAASNWDANSTPLKRFHLPNGESISCVLWDGLYFVTGTDIVRSLTFRFHAFGRPITNTKKFEEGIFSDLRNLKPGIDAQLEDPKSNLLDMLYKNNCIRTQKKQKVFFWYSVPHDRLFLDALERELKREKMGLQPTTIAIAEPATSTSLDTTQELFDQLRKSMSISAAATAHALEEEISSSCMTWDSNMSRKSTATTTFSPRMDDQLGQRNNRTPRTPTLPKAATAIDPASALSERAQVRRSHVSSVPNDVGQDQDQTLQQQKQQRQHYRTNHGPYFSPTSTETAASQRRQRTFSNLVSGDSPTLPSLLNDGKRHSPLTPRPQQQKPRTSSHHHHLASHENHHRRHHQQPTTKSGALSSKSLDSNSIKKTKTIFGALSLFDGSPTYKQRRRRAASASSSSTQQQQQQQQQQKQKQKPTVAAGGGPNRIRRHTDCHLRTASASSIHRASSTVNGIAHQPTSRLAMAARDAGFDRTPPSDHSHPHPHPRYHHHHEQSFNPSQQCRQPLDQRHQRSHQEPSVNMHPCSMPISSDPVMPPQWNAIMDNSFNGLGQDEVMIAASNSVSTPSNKFFDDHQLETYDMGLHHHPDLMIKNESNCNMDGRHYGYHHPSSLHHLHQGVTTHALESIAATTADTTLFESNAVTSAHQDTSMYQQQLGRGNGFGASPDSSRCSLSSTSSSLQPTPLATTTMATAEACIAGGMVSPVDDMDLDIKDVLPIDTMRHQQHYPTVYSPGRSDYQDLTPIVSDVSPPFSTDFMVPPYSTDYSEGSGTMLSPEDEFSSASSASPSSILHYQNYYDVLAPPMYTNDNNHNSVLLSPFKPDMYPNYPTSSSFATSPKHQHPSPSFYYHDHSHHDHQHIQDILHPMSSSSSSLYHNSYSNKNQPSYTL